MRRQFLVTLDIDEGEDELKVIDVELIQNFLSDTIENLDLEASFELGLAVEEFPVNSEVFLGEVQEDV